VRVTDDLGGQNTDSVVITVSNHLPTAALSSDVSSGLAPLTVHFDGSASSDPDGSIATYEFDFDGNGTYDTSGSSATTTHTYSSAGTFNAMLRVTDNDGGQDTATVQITAQAWTGVLVASGGGNINCQSLELINGKPAFAFKGGDADLLYAYTSASNGLSGWSTLTVDSAGDQGTTASLAEVDGCPAIGYIDFSNFFLKYALSTASDGSGGWGTQTIATGNWQRSSLAVVNGFPALAGCSSGIAYYFRSTTADGSSGWASPVAASAMANVDLLDLNGKPSLAGWGPAFLNYAYSTSTNGASGSWTLIHPSFMNANDVVSLADLNGSPAIAFNHNSAVNFAWTTTANGASGWSSLPVPTSCGGGSPALAVIGGKPAIVHGGSGALRYSYSTTSDGSSGWVTTTVVSGAGFFNGDLVELGDGSPGIAYSNSSSNQLRFITLQ